MDRPEFEIETRKLVKGFRRDGGWRGILKRSRQRIVLDGIDLAVRGGEIFGLLGPNGAGKTTLTKILAGLLLPTSGAAYISGLDVSRHSLEVRRRIGLVYGDERSFFWRLSVYENLRFYAALFGLNGEAAKRRIAELLEFVDLGHAADVRMDRISSGMKQRVSIARGLLNDPPVLLLDEPTRMLDPVGTREIRRLIRHRLTADGRRTVLLATNLMAEAEELCDRVVLLKEGRIHMAGTVDELRLAVQIEEIHVLVVSGLPGYEIESLGRLPGVGSVNVRNLSNDSVEIALGVGRGSTIVPEAVQLIVERGGRVWSITPRELSLDEIFVQAVREETATVPQQDEEPTAVGSQV